MYQVEMDRNMMSFGMPLENVKATVTVNLSRQKAVTSNVAAILPGMDPSLSDQYVVVGAHYDHLGWGTDSSLAEGEDPQIHPGADDNASGVAGLLELAGMFSSSPVRPARSILFISFSAEELGALGSDWYVEHPLVPMENTVAMINMDMIGRVRLDENGTPVAWVYGLSTASEWSGIVPSKTPDGQVSLNLISTPLAGGDYAPFQTAGIPSINFTSGSHEEFHRPTDRVDLINFAGEASLIGAVYQVIEKVADYSTKFAFQQPAGPTPPEGETGGNPPYTVYLGTVPDFTRTEGGFWISAVNEGSPAQAAGLKGGDRILRVGDYEVTDIYDYTSALGHFNPGDSTQIVVLRGDEEITLTVTFGSREDGK
jgi:Zn-dependent M28 family amino/carboxypeptidase